MPELKTRFEFIPKSKLYSRGIHYENFSTIVVVQPTSVAMAQEAPHKNNNAYAEKERENKSKLVKKLDIDNINNTINDVIVNIFFLDGK